MVCKRLFESEEDIDQCVQLNSSSASSKFIQQNKLDAIVSRCCKDSPAPTECMLDPPACVVKNGKAIAVNSSIPYGESSCPTLSSVACSSCTLYSSTSPAPASSAPSTESPSLISFDVCDLSEYGINFNSTACNPKTCQDLHQICIRLFTSAEDQAKCMEVNSAPATTQENGNWSIAGATTIEDVQSSCCSGTSITPPGCSLDAPRCAHNNARPYAVQCLPKDGSHHVCRRHRTSQLCAADSQCTWSQETSKSMCSDQTSPDCASCNLYKNM